MTFNGLQLLKQFFVDICGVDFAPFSGKANGRGSTNAWLGT